MRADKKTILAVILKDAANRRHEVMSRPTVSNAPVDGRLVITGRWAGRTVRNSSN